MASEMSILVNNETAEPEKASPPPGATKWAWLLLPGALFLAALFIAPLLILFLLSLGMPNWTFANFQRIADNPAYFSVLRTTLEISVSVTILAFVLGYPIAYMLTTGGSRVRSFLLLAVVLPYFTSVLARTFAWIVLLGRGGIVNEMLLQTGLISQPVTMLYNRVGVIIGMTHIIMPLMILPMSTVMAGIDQRLMRAARANGASPLAAFMTVFLPLSLPGVIAGILLVFIYCLGFYITPALLGGLSDLMITMEISSQVVEQLNWNFGSALSMVLLVVVLFILWVGSRFFPIDQLLGFSTDESGKSTARREVGTRWLMALGSRANSIEKWIPSFCGYGIPSLACFLGVLLLLPVMIVAYLSFSSSNYFEFPAPGYSLRNYQAYFSDPLWIGATFTSLRVAVMAATLATLLGAMLAFGLSRGRVRGRGAMVALVLSPIIMPTVVVAVATYFLLARVGLQGTEFGLALGHAVHAIPFVVVIVVANLRDLNPTYERAARSLGASPLATFRTITTPLVTPALVVAAFFAFLTSFDDVVYVLFLGIGKITTLPMRMWDGIKQDVNPTISAVATLQIVLAATVIVISHFLRRRPSN
ncbi:ABC-type spermidine/putrescine transport system, permease component I [Neorhizobium galegae bv. officinalis]|uniref:ABC-type spermidine/putrescine transport system, permease component I n=1 Tax=Neorhizobium galegae bv. officinalis TaxID=323656 RepID=A0A0T7G0M8_NEOGA|nr:ABC transporter permease subunit [Neorhizobium galegae]CDZ40809.1 ABC-type spermidine/putrescine transport system, permease component I [Neorhizobium galegae bv. officinalis]CDZ54614.1 ABC-type spermidine/putrescine transport system, permease component I [Neorhizobium galegae bv. officinalis]